MIEMVTKISQAEDAAAISRREAQTKASEMEAAAVKAGKETIAKAKSEGEAEATRLIEDATAEAKQLGEQKLAAAHADSGGLAAAASAKLDEVAKLIVERIVETK